MSERSSLAKILFILFCLFQFVFIDAQIDFGPQAQFKYLKGSEAATLPDSWKDVGFDDAAWATGNAPFYYDTDNMILGGSELTDMQNSYSTAYLRGTFTVTDVHLVSVIELGVDFDDGFIVWINGEYLHSINAPDPPAYNAFSTDLHENGTFEYFAFDSTDIKLVEGENIIAIQGFNTSLESSDFLLDISLQADRDPPSLTDVEINTSHESGFYAAPFSLNISTSDNTTSIYYTLDGSHPGTSPTAVNAGNGTNITIDPNSSVGRGITPGVVLRACLKKADFKTSFPMSRTFIFTEELKTQGHPGANWPNDEDHSQYIDYDMDEDVVTGATFLNEYQAALDQVPTISIITDNASLFDPETGMYVNAMGHGIEWERECSVELFNTDQDDGFGVNAGLRIRGGWSRHDEFPKHAFRLFFRALYGDPKLYYPLFEDEGVSQFDKVDLRCSQNYAWSVGRTGMTYVREVWSRDAQREMGWPYTRSRYYHLFLNGMYWGLFQTQERSEARFSSDYHGGSPEDYDVVKVATDLGYVVEATDGNLDSWRGVWNILNDGFEDNANYFKLEGKDALGIQNGSEVHVNLDNLIDYMLGIFYSGNYDAPVSQFSNNVNPNNFFTIDNREDKSSGFIFYQHDAEHALFYERSEGAGIGIEMDRVNIGYDGFPNMNVSEFEKFHPQWLHFKLTDNAEYRIRFMDRAYKHLGPGGIFTEERGVALANERIEQIDQAILMESARWGDAVRDNLQTRDDDWYPELSSLLDDFFPARTEIVIGQLGLADLWTEISPPAFHGNNGLIEEHIVTLNTTESFEIHNTYAAGSICYTTNGKDPRDVGGSLHERSFLSYGKVSMSIANSTIIKARILFDGKWSALNTIKFVKEDEDYSGLKVTELHYNPIDRLDGTDTIYGEDYEFIEFKNTGPHPIDLTGLCLDSAVYYKFPDNEILTPRQFFVIASNPGRFYDVHGLVPSGNYKRNFSNAGELIVLEDKDQNEILRFVYDDVYPWPFGADGGGNSMVVSLRNPVLTPGEAAYWIDSRDIEGSPFADDPESELSVPVFAQETGLIVYPNPTSDYFIFRTDLPEKNELYKVTIFNLSGSVVYAAEAAEGEEIHLSGKGLGTGLYFVQLRGSELNERVKIIYKAH